MNLDGLNPTNSFELKLLDVLKSGEAFPVTVTHEAKAEFPVEVIEALGLLADKLATLEREFKLLKSRVDVHSENFAALQDMAGGT